MKSKKPKANKTPEEIAILNRDGQVKVTLNSLFKNRIKSTGNLKINYRTNIKFGVARIYLTSENKIGRFVNFALLKEISNKLKTDLIDLGSERRSKGCDTCSMGAESSITISITL